MPLLTERQAHVLRFVRRHIAEHEYAPTLDEIVRQTRVGSPRRVTACLQALQRKGCLRWTPGASRSIELPATGPTSLSMLPGLLNDAFAQWQSEPEPVLCHS